MISNRLDQKIDKKAQEKEFSEEVIRIDRVTRVVAGGKRMRFRAAVVIGNKAGKVAIGIAKANEVILAIQKAIRKAEKHLILVPIVNDTIPHDIRIKLGASQILLKPASPGTGIIAGGVVRSTCEAAGIKNIIGKILGSQNKINNLKALMFAFQSLRPIKKEIPQSSEKNLKQSPKNASVVSKEESLPKAGTTT